MVRDRACRNPYFIWLLFTCYSSKQEEAYDWDAHDSENMCIHLDNHNGVTDYVLDDA